jgi:hypothetical protein
MADSISNVSSQIHTRGSSHPAAQTAGRKENREAAIAQSLEPVQGMTPQQAAETSQFYNGVLSHIDAIRNQPLPTLKPAGQKAAQGNEASQQVERKDSETGSPSLAGTPFAAGRNHDRIPALLRGNNEIRSSLPEKWRSPLDPSDRTELAKALPQGTPINVVISTIKAMPAKDVDPEKLKAFSDAGRISQYKMYNGNVPFKRAEPPSGPQVNLVGKGMFTPDMPVRTSVTDNNGVVEMRLTNTDKIKALGGTAMEKGQYALRVVMVPYSDKEGAEPSHYLFYAVGGGNLNGHEKEFTGLTEDMSRWLIEQVKK